MDSQPPYDIHNVKPLSTRSYPRAIVHFDGDAFFASVEQALNYKLRGKPVVTGRERFIAASMSYEAKALGVRRGMPIQEIKRVCPQVIFVPSNYEMYSIYARRMYNIVRKYTPDVEEYSIDECFADITGLRQLYRMPYEKIALMIKQDLERELGITFGVGLGPNKSIAKMASKWKKPAGFTPIPGKKIHQYAAQTPIGSMWGIGGSTGFYFQKLGIKTAYDFALKDERWIDSNHISKPYKEIWLELQGYFIKKLSTNPVEDIGSIIRSRTFVPASKNPDYIFSQLSKNIEEACKRARYYKVTPREIRFYLKTQEFRHYGLDITLPVPSSVPTDILNLVKEKFNNVYKPGVLYRATGIVLKNIVAEHAVTLDLFGKSTDTADKQTLFKQVDKMNHKYGDRTLFLGSTYAALKKEDGTPIKKKMSKLDYRSLDIPFLGKVR